MSSLAPEPRLPAIFGRYVLFDFIGKGGMAEIYLARQEMNFGLSRLCVVKQISPELAGAPGYGGMFVHEAKLAASLNHQNVVQVFDLGREGDRLYIAMEYVEGFDLNDLLGRCSKQKVSLPVELMIDVVREVLRGLDYAHRRADEEGRPLGLVHRDVSPSNVLLSFDGEVKLCDFGIARANAAFTPEAAPQDLDQALRGKAGYMSPEHARGEDLDARADVFAAGIILWELLAGRRLYRQRQGEETLLEQARRAEIPELPPSSLPEYERLRAIAMKALSVDRDARYPSAAAMLREIDEWAAAANVRTSPLSRGQWLTDTFGQEIVSRRRERERALSTIAAAPPSTPVLPAATPPEPQEPPAPALRRPDPRRRWNTVYAFVAALIAVAGVLLATSMR